MQDVPIFKIFKQKELSSLLVFKIKTPYDCHALSTMFCMFMFRRKERENRKSE